MKYRGINLLLVAVIASGAIIYALNMSNMRNQISVLQINQATLQTSYNNLQSGYNEIDLNYRTTLNNYNLLDENYNTLETNFNYVQADLKSLRADYNLLEADYEYLESEHNKLKGEVTGLNSEIRQLNLEKSDLQRIVDEYEKVPHSYYSMDVFKSYENTWEGLSKFLSSGFKLPRDYEIDVFDCSESAAYLEWALENAGFMAEIVVGPSPSGEIGVDHAWIIVQTRDYQVAVEATWLNTKERYAALSWSRVPGVIYGDDTLIDEWENYYEGYDESFKNIYIAIREFGYSNWEWNWWEESFSF